MPKKIETDKPVQVWYPEEVHAKLIRIQFLLYEKTGFRHTLDSIALESSICGMKCLCNEYKIEL